MKQQRKKHPAAQKIPTEGTASSTGGKAAGAAQKSSAEGVPTPIDGKAAVKPQESPVKRTALQRNGKKSDTAQKVPRPASPANTAGQSIPKTGMSAKTGDPAAGIRILYRDAYLLAAEKPIGVLSEKSADGKDILSLLEAQVGGYIGSVHRLDRTTGGAMLFSRDPRVTGKISEAIAAHDGSFEKEYLAVAEGIPEPSEGRMEDFLFLDRTRGKVFVVRGERKGAKRAILDYRVQDSRINDKGNPLSLCRVLLHTGRTHQIRAQFAARRCPLAGDGKYGGRDNRSPAAALWSHRISFLHPVTGERVEVYSAPPADRYPWNLWEDAPDREQSFPKAGIASEGIQKTE